MRQGRSGLGRRTAALLSAGATAFAVLPASEALPLPDDDLPPALAREAFCAVVIEADARASAGRLGSTSGAGAEFALRNDGFRSAWLFGALQQADPARDWRAKLDAIAARLPIDVAAPELAGAYGRCLEEQNRDPAFVAALHAYLPYTDAP